jgi:ribosomal protein S18 acetylase RimI-like enzyme
LSIDGALTFRPEGDTEADRAFLFALFAASKAADMALMPIDAARKDFLLRAQYRSMAATYRHTYPTARWEVIELAGAPIGRLITHVAGRFVTFVDIALAAEAQRRGLATRVMTQALEEPRRLGLLARVNVLAMNGASLKLCERVGFVRIGESPPFVELEWRP